MQPSKRDSPQNNERAHLRHLLARFVWYTTVELDGATPFEGISYSVDISQGGMALVGKEAIALGKLLLVRVLFDRDRFTLSAVAQVMHAQPAPDDCFRLGLRFVTLPPEARQYLQQGLGAVP